MNVNRQDVDDDYQVLLNEKSKSDNIVSSNAELERRTDEAALRERKKRVPQELAGSGEYTA